MSEDADYMSDDIIASCLENDVRPGLLHSHSQQRSAEIARRKAETDMKNKKLNPNMKVLEKETREEGLSKSIGSENKGFAMLQKMGYKPGQAIGKTGDGRTEPVPVVLKVDRQGFGREAALRELATQRQAIRARHRNAAQTLDLDGFRQRHSQRATERQTLSDLFKSQRVCEQLDTQQNVTEAVHSWFWPQREKPTEEAEEKKEDEEEKEEEQEEPEEEFEPSEQLEMLTLYLRRSYCYCVWCGTKFDDDKDLEESCPGPTRDDH